MGYARSHLVDPTAPGFYHCVSRCVRRAFLCGFDRESNICFEHRREWLEKRIHLLAAQFAVGIQAYAVMSNHLHLVIAIDPGEPARWDDAEVVRRWRTVFPVRSKSEHTDEPEDPRIVLTPEQRIESERISTWRQRLGSLSWFMRALLEPIARRANQDDGCTGRFWEGRFFSQALLDERAILAACAYVDLNPVRADMAASLAESAHTGVAWRLARQQPKGNEQATAPTEPVAAAIAAAPTTETPTLPAVAGGCRIADCLPIREAQYVELVAWSGKVPVGLPVLAPVAQSEAADRGVGAIAVLRAVFDCDPSEWLAEFTAIRNRWRLVGGSQKMRAWMERHGWRWIRRKNAPAPRRVKPAS